MQSVINGPLIVLLMASINGLINVPQTAFLINGLINVPKTLLDNTRIRIRPGLSPRQEPDSRSTSVPMEQEQRGTLPLRSRQFRRRMRGMCISIRRQGPTRRRRRKTSSPQQEAQANHRLDIQSLDNLRKEEPSHLLQGDDSEVANVRTLLQPHRITKPWSRSNLLLRPSPRHQEHFP